MNTKLAIALYKPKEGKDSELKEIVKQHLPVLREYGLVTDKPGFVAQAEDGTIIEIFEWLSDEAKDAAHQHPAIARIWEAMMPIADFPSFNELSESKKKFISFPVISFE